VVHPLGPQARVRVEPLVVLDIPLLFETGGLERHGVQVGRAGPWHLPPRAEQATASADKPGSGALHGSSGGGHARGWCLHASCRGG
jgi:hypothetical protein